MHENDKDASGIDSEIPRYVHPDIPQIIVCRSAQPAETIKSSQLEAQVLRIVCRAAAWNSNFPLSC